MNKKLSLLKTNIIPGVKGNIFLAPIAGWSDAAFRSICINWGADLAFTEMISAEGLSREKSKSLNLLAKANNEKKYAVQIFTSQPEKAAKSAYVLNKYKPALIDLNCGCSVPKVLKAGCGAFLLQEPKKIKNILKAIKSETNIPVSVKIRTGWDHNTINYLEVAENAIEGGASLITLHPRTRSQLFTSFADWSHLKILKEHIDIPVIGSGDLFSSKDVIKMLSETNCDGIMIARGALGNPFIFKEVKNYLKNKKNKEISNKRKIKTAYNHLKKCIKFKGEKTACKEMRKHFCSYSKGIRNSANFRKKIVSASTLEEYKIIIQEFNNKGIL